MPANTQTKFAEAGKAPVAKLRLVQVVRFACATHEGHRVPRDGWKLRGIETHRAVERVVKLDIEFLFQPGEIRTRCGPDSEVVEVVVGVMEAPVVVASCGVVAAARPEKP